MSGELVYASWGGAGSGSSLREAVGLAAGEGRDLVYLAILDRRNFAELDRQVVEAVEQELDWLLRSQVEMVRRQVGAADTDVRIVVTAGEVDNVIEDFVAAAAAAEVLIGAPVLGEPLDAHRRSVEDLLADLERSTKTPVRVVGVG